MRALFTRSVVAAARLSAGTVLSSEHLAIKKPGTGLPPTRLPEIVGRRLTRDVAADHLLTAEDIEGFDGR
jgi:sialic acid synthase SpsE